MAFAAAAAERAAVARAEWFVTDYFTADLEPSGSADVRTALPAGAELPDMPQDAAASLSYVEWARAFRVEEAGDGLFRVGVVFRALGAPPDRGFYRLPVRAVEVLVQVNEDGGSVVVDLPTPVALPAGPEPSGLARGGPGAAPPGGRRRPGAGGRLGRRTPGGVGQPGRGRLAGGAHPGRRGGQPLAGRGVRGGRRSD